MYIRETKVKPNPKTDTVKKTNKTNKTGLPDRLKYGIENISGYSMDDVRVHYNSAKPAQMKSLAYTQGSEIYVAPGQERHLSHEAWHVVQQKQGRVAPTEQMNGININSSRSLEQEADTMGAKAIQMRFSNPAPNLKNTGAVPCVQKMKGDLCCQATIEYGGDNQGTASAEGLNDASDKDKVIETFSKYGLEYLAKVKQWRDSNPPGQCAEPHAVANALKSGIGKICKIKSIRIGPAQYTDDFKARISKQIERGEMSTEDLTMVSTLINNNNIDITDITAKDNKKGEIKDIVIIADNMRVSKKGLISRINKSNLIRLPCLTCKQWINGGFVIGKYCEIPVIGEFEKLKQSIDGVDKLLQEELNQGQMQECKENLQIYKEKLLKEIMCFMLPVEGSQETLERVEQLIKEIEERLASGNSNSESKETTGPEQTAKFE